MATVQTPLAPTTPFPPPGPASILDQLPTWNVLIPDRDDVIRYLTKFPDVGSPLPSVSAELRRSFGADVELSLEVYHDPEIFDEYLSLYVRKDRYQAGFIQEIEAVRDRFDALLDSTIGYLLVTTDYHRRRDPHGV